MIRSKVLSRVYDEENKQIWNTGQITLIFSCLIWQMQCLLWSFSGRCCDVRGVHPHIITKMEQILEKNSQNFFGNYPLSDNYLQWKFWKSLISKIFTGSYSRTATFKTKKIISIILLVMNNWKRCKELEKRKPVRKREFYSRGSKVSQIM